LTSVGAPHAWPSLLAALVWLVELNQYKDSSENLISLDSNEENKQFFTYLSKSYQSYLRCESSDYVVMEDEIRKLFQVKDKEIIAEIEKYLSYIADLQQECDEYTESPLVQLEKKKKSYESEIDKLKQLISARFENKQNLDAKNEVLERESNKLAISIEKCQFERDILRKQVEQQELSPDDVKRMYNELNHLESSQITLTKQYQNVKQNEWNLEKETRNANEEIVSSVQNFNRKVTRLPQHLNILFDFQEIDTKSVESKLRKFQNENLSQLHLEQDLNLKLKDKLEKSEWEKETLMDTTKQSSMKIQGLEKQFKQEKEQWRSEMQQNAFNLESMEQENQKLKHLEQQDSDLKITSMQIETSMIELEKLKTKISNEEKQMTDLLYKTLELMTEHKTKNQFLLSNLEDKLKLTLNSVISTDDEMME
jgi:kinetochore protein NDC80